MSKIMLLEVTGGSLEDFIFSPIRRVVEVQDEVELVGHIRARIMKRLIDDSACGKFPEDKIDSALRTLKVKLKDLGIDTYPETPEEEMSLYERILNGENVTNKNEGGKPLLPAPQDLTGIR